MTDRFKEAKDEMLDLFASGFNVTREQLLVFLNTNQNTIREALTLATEAEQLRRKQDELAQYIREARTPMERPDTHETAKRIIENGNA